MQCDVVTIGGGFSGLITACCAAEFGLSVAVLEARSEDRYPCSSRWVTGAANVMGLPILNEPDRLYAAIPNGSGRNANLAVAARARRQWQARHRMARAAGAQFTSRALRHEQSGQRVLSSRCQLSGS